LQYLGVKRIVSYVMNMLTHMGPALSLKKGIATGPQRGMEQLSYPKSPPLGSDAPCRCTPFAALRHLLKCGHFPPFQGGVFQEIP
jgi:hypothetical protein